MNGKPVTTDALIELVLARRARRAPAGLVKAITAAVAEIPQVRRPWWTRAMTPSTAASTPRLSWILVLLALLLAAAVGVGLVGAGVLWRDNRLAVVVPPQSPTPTPSATLTATTSAFGVVAWSTIDVPSSGIWWPLVGTPRGPVAIVEREVGDGHVADLRWPGPEGNWLRLTLPDQVFRLHPVGDALIVSPLGYDAAYWLRWSGSSWVVGEPVDVEDLTDANDVAVGPRGTLLTDGMRIAYSTDGSHFARAVRPPDKAELQPNAAECGQWGGAGGENIGEGHIGPIIGTEQGFIALTAADPADWVLDPICEPVVWFSSDGSSWDLVSPSSPFGPGAYVREVASRAGRHVAIGNVPPTASDEGNAAWVSEDGLSWARLLMPEPDGPCQLAEPLVCGHVFSRVVAGDAGWIILDSEGFAWTSADGRTWESASGWPAIPAGWLPQGLALSPGSIVETSVGEVGVIGRFGP